MVAIDFGVLGDDIFKRAHGLSHVVRIRRFSALFGATPIACNRAWKMIENYLPPGCLPKHLLWAMIFIKIYATEHVNATITESDEKTFRKWVWIILNSSSNLKLVCSIFKLDL